jgi:tetratricopeptide (TPR) repeat protein
MAGAFSAVSSDISFLEFNPAGSSMLQNTELAFFHNNWISDVNMEGIAYTTRFGNLGLAGGMKWLYMPFTEYNIYGERVSGGNYSEGVGILNASYNFFSGYHFSGVSFGMNLKGAFRLMPDFTDYEDNLIIGSGSDNSAMMLMADIGALTRFDLFKRYASRDNNASAALVIRNIGPPSMGHPLPTAINAAISYKPIRPLTLALDFTQPINLQNLSESERWYLAFGASANVTNFLTMHGGFMLKTGSNRLTIGSAINLNRIALDVNYTLDMLTQSQFIQPLNRISLGVRLDLGDRGRRELSDRVDELYFLGLEAFSRGNLVDARLCWEEALRLNPRFEPAIESLAMLEEREAILQRVEELYRFGF